MPWKETTAMEQKLEFISEWRTQKFTITELCKAFGISRPTGYKLIHRFEEQGIEGLLDRDKTPKRHPNKTNQPVEDEIIRLKEKYPLWGAKKIRRLLLNDFSENEVPSVVTVHKILSGHGIASKEGSKGKACLPNFCPQRM